MCVRYDNLVFWRDDTLFQDESKNRNNTRYQTPPSKGLNANESSSRLVVAKSESIQKLNLDNVDIANQITDRIDKLTVKSTYELNEVKKIIENITMKIQE